MSTRGRLLICATSLVTTAIASLIAACSSAGGQATPSPDGGGGKGVTSYGGGGGGQSSAPDGGVVGWWPDGAGQPDSSGGGGSSDTGAPDAALLGDASGTDGALDAGIADSAIADAAPEAEAGGATAPAVPSLLSATGLFTSVEADGGLVLAEGVQEYQPLYPLWSDGAQKTRWMYLPPGATIDTTDMSHWSFPAGTKFGKSSTSTASASRRASSGNGAPARATFSTWRTGGIPRRESRTTRRRRTRSSGSRTSMGPPITSRPSKTASLPQFAQGARARLRSHRRPNHTLPGANIHTLIDAGTLTVSPALAELQIPGNATEQAALGYLHANCGNCHNDSPGNPGTPSVNPMYLRLSVGTATVQATQTYTTAVNQATTDFTPDNIMYRIEGQDPAGSCIVYVMEQRNNSAYKMPPIASNFVDDAGVAAVSAWVDLLPKP